MTNITLKTLATWRRDFHAYPETGWAEFVTTAKIVNLLETMGHKVLTGTQVIHPDFVRGRNIQIVNTAIEAAKRHGVSDAMLQRMEGYTGCVAVLETGKAGPVTAFRFDIDCVNVEESADAAHRPNQDNFSSTNPGYMHSCGHDGHTAIGLGVAQWLMDNKAKLTGTFKLLFQPAEEGVRGARPMVESGILDDVDYFACAHLGCDIPSGTIIAAPEKFLSTIKLDLRYHGKPAHAGMEPHKGKNALLAACHATTQVMDISRHGEGMTRINVGVLKAGEGRNVIPVDAEMQVEVRGESEAITHYMLEEVVRRAKGVALSFDVDLATEVMGEATDFIADVEMVDIVVKAAKQVSAVKDIQHTIIFNGSDDATIMIRRVQENGGKATYFIIGSDLKAGHHQSEFDIDETQLLTGFNMFVEIVHVIQAKASS